MYRARVSPPPPLGLSPRARLASSARNSRAARPTARRTTIAMGGQHTIDKETLPYHPDKLERKEDVAFADLLKLDIRVGKLVDVQDFPEMRKPSYKICVDFGDRIGRLWSSAQIMNYSREQVSLRG